MFTRVPAPTRRLLGSVVAAPRRLIATRGADRPLRVAIAGAGVSGSILAAQLSKHANVEVTLLERFARGALPPGLNLLLNHNGMAALGALDADLANAVKAVGDPMVSWSAATLSGKSLYSLGDVAAPGAGFAEGDECATPLADTYGVRGRWRDLTATCQLAAVASNAEIHWRTEISDVVFNGNGGSRPPLTLTLRHAAEVAGGPDSYSNQEELGRPAEDASVIAARKAAEEEAWRNARVVELDVDLLVGCDGRYSAVRRMAVDASDEVVSYGPPYVSDFRLVVPISDADVNAFFSGADAQDLRRVYNVPHPENVARIIAKEELERPENASFATHCAAGLARVGVMTIAPSRLDAWGLTAEAAAATADADGSPRSPEKTEEPLFVGFFGNFKMPEGENEPIPPLAKTSAGLRAMFTPAGGESQLDALGRFVLDTLSENASSVHWTRMQSTPQRVLPGVTADPSDASAPPPSSMAKFGGRVLLLGDAAGAMYPALGQGANQAIEDACAASHVLGAACAQAEAANGEVDVASAVDAIWQLRQPRREFVSEFSKQHSAHIARSDGEASLSAEAADWMGTEGGRFDALPGKATGSWRKGLRQLWSGWQRPAECTQAFERARMRQAAHRSTSSSSSRSAGMAMGGGVFEQRSGAGAAVFTQQRGLSTAGAVSLVKTAKTADRYNFAPYGDLVSVAPDGENWSKDKDADLVGFDGKHGFPRFYLMQLYGPRPYQFDRITHHARVTQCLGAASATEDFYLAVHAPTLGADGEASPPDPAKVEVFRVAPHTFVKLHCGTWHAGPIWGEAAERVFYNLELHDTNEVDHNTVVFDDTYTFEPLES